MGLGNEQVSCFLSNSKSNFKNIILYFKKSLAFASLPVF